MKFYNNTKKFWKYYCLVFGYYTVFYVYDLMTFGTQSLFPNTNRVLLGLQLSIPVLRTFLNFYLAPQYSLGNCILTKGLEHVCNPHLFSSSPSLKHSFIKIQLSQILAQTGKRYVSKNIFYLIFLILIFCLLN